MPPRDNATIPKQGGGVYIKRVLVDAAMKADSLMEKTISKAILGGTLTSQADGKSSTNALGNVHNEVRQELRDSDLKQIANTLTRDLVFPLYYLNGKSYQTPQRSPRFEFDITEAEDLKAFSDSLPALIDIGFKVPARWAHEKLQIPEPQKDEAVLARAAAPVSTQAVGSTSVVENEAHTPTTTDEAKAKLKACLPLDNNIAVFKTKPTLLPDQQAIENLLDQLDNNELQQQAQEILQPIFDLINQHGVEGAMEHLAQAWPSMNDSKLQEQLAKVLFVAEVWGRINA